MTTPDPPATTPCTWPIDTSAAHGWSDAEPGQQGTAAAIATYVMWALSGRRFGLCTRTIRPCPPPMAHLQIVSAPAGGRYTTPWAGWPGGPGWCSHPGGGCGCAAGHDYQLPGPVSEVTEVLIDGEVLDPAQWRVDGDRIIRRDARWPVAQDLALDATEPGTWQVTYVAGIPVPVAGQYATGILAGEALKAIRLDARCKLPGRAQSVARQGVDVQLIDPATFLEAGRTGLPEVDLWLAAVNPRRQVAPAQVWSPDLPGNQR